MNEAMNNLLTRRSCRKYKPDMLPQEVLDEILKAGTYAASGHGTQNPIMIAVTDKQRARHAKPHYDCRYR